VTHASQFGTRQSWKPDLTSHRKGGQDDVDLCFHSVYRLYQRPNTVPSRWDTVRAPGDFPPGRLTQPRGQAALPLHTIPRLPRRRGAGVRAPPKGTCLETLTLPPPYLPSKIYPTPENCLPAPRGSHSTPRQVTQPTAGRSGKGPRTSGTGFKPLTPKAMP